LVTHVLERHNPDELRVRIGRPRTRPGNTLRGIVISSRGVDGRRRDLSGDKGEMAGAACEILEELIDGCVVAHAHHVTPAARREASMRGREHLLSQKERDIARTNE